MNSVNVVFRGKVIEGAPVSQAKETLGRLLKISDSARLEHLFSGAPRILKKSITQDAALSLQEKLARHGIACDIEPARQSQADAVQRESVAMVLTVDDFAIAPELEGNAQSNTLDRAPAKTNPERKKTGRAVFEARDLTSPSDHHQEAGSFQHSPTRGHARAEMLLNQNTSGQGSMAVVPSDVSGWCWGGFLLGWIWAIFNKTYIGLLTLVPLVNLPMFFVLGAKGREWAWRNKQWRSVEHFNDVQRKWSISGLAVLLLVVWLWFGAVREAEKAVENMPQEIERLEQRLDEIENPEAREQLRQLIELQKQLQEKMNK